MNANVGVLSVVVPVAPELIVVSGAVVSAGGVAAPTVMAFIVVAVSPSASATVTRTFLTPASWKVNDIVLPLPSGHWSPAGPSPPSSSQVYVHGVSAHVALEASNETASPTLGEAGVVV